MSLRDFWHVQIPLLAVVFNLTLETLLFFGLIAFMSVCSLRQLHTLLGVESKKDTHGAVAVLTSVPTGVWGLGFGFWVVGFGLISIRVLVHRRLTTGVTVIRN